VIEFVSWKPQVAAKLKGQLRSKSDECTSIQEQNILSSSTIAELQGMVHRARETEAQQKQTEESLQFQLEALL
jgi:hypothetical protein